MKLKYIYLTSSLFLALLSCNQKKELDPLNNGEDINYVEKTTDSSSTTQIVESDTVIAINEVDTQTTEKPNNFVLPEFEDEYAQQYALDYISLSDTFLTLINNEADTNNKRTILYQYFDTLELLHQKNEDAIIYASEDDQDKFMNLTIEIEEKFQPIKNKLIK